MRGRLPLILLSHPAAAVVVALVGCGLCATLGLRPNWGELSIAAALTLVSAELAMVPLYFVRGKTQSDVSQAALASTVIHLLGSAAAGTAVLQWAHPHKAFIYWLCAFYWTTLATVSTVVVRAIKSAPAPVGPAMPAGVQSPVNPSLQGSEA